MRNVLAHAGKSGRGVVSAFIATAFAQETPEAASTEWRAVADQIRPKVPKLATIMDDTEPDVLAYVTFPKEHIDKSDVGSFVSLFGSGEPVSSSRPTHRHRLPCRDAVKAGRRTDGSAGHDASRPCLDGVEHGARLEQTVSAIVVTAHSLCYDRPARTTTWRRVAREDESAAAQPIVAPPLWRPCAASALVIASAGPSARRHARHFRLRPSPSCATP